MWTPRRERGHLYIDGERTWIGSFHDEIDAAEAYDEAARQHIGPMARLNFANS